LTDHDRLMIRLALTDAEACLGYDHGDNTPDEEARYEAWWTDKGEDAAESDATSNDVRRDVVERLRAAVAILDGALGVKS
jgi:hypothetical protein